MDMRSNDIVSWTLYWPEYMNNSYIYGTEVVFYAKDDVEFHNNLVPPGTVLKKWFSKVNYQAMRIEPMLPIIDGESSYRIDIDIDEIDPADIPGWLVRIVFYDRYQMEAGAVIVRSTSQPFRCPLKTYSYEVQLLNAGNAHFHFHSITITEVEGESREA